MCILKTENRFLCVFGLNSEEGIWFTPVKPVDELPLLSAQCVSQKTCTGLASAPSPLCSSFSCLKCHLTLVINWFTFYIKVRGSLPFMLNVPFRQSRLPSWSSSTGKPASGITLDFLRMSAAVGAEISPCRHSCRIS